jgi:MFS family permease
MNGAGRPRVDSTLFVVARGARGFGAGALSIVFALDLESAGYSLLTTGILVGVAMAAGAGWAIAAPRLEAKLGRRRLLLVGALLFAAGGVLLWAYLASPWAVLLALLLGGIVTGTSDISPLGAAEQAGLTATSPAGDRTLRFAVYNLVGYVGAALGAVAAAPLTAIPLQASWLAPGAHDPALLLYGALGVALIPMYRSLSTAVESGVRAEPTPLRPESRRPILELTGLFAVDAFGGGLIVNSLFTAFLVERFHPPLLSISLVLFGGNIAAAVSLLLAVPLARRFGLVRTMVFSHIPSNLLLIAVAFGPTVWLAGALWVARSTLSQMDVPTRQAFVQTLVRPEERTAAAGYTTAGRSGQALGAPVTGALLGFGGPWIAAPFVLAGSVKVAYDLVLYSRFRQAEAPDPGARGPST